MFEILDTFLPVQLPSYFSVATFSEYNFYSLTRRCVLIRIMFVRFNVCVCVWPYEGHLILEGRIAHKGTHTDDEIMNIIESYVINTVTGEELL